MIELGKQNRNSFHLAGVIPVAGQKLDFNFPWHDSLQPINKDYLAIERAVIECAYAGCETVWIVCHRDMQPLIRYVLGDYVQDPTLLNKKRVSMAEEVKKTIPIYYVPVHPKDKDKRDSLGWSILYGALTAYWLSKTISKWVIPDKYYVSFPYGVYKPELLQKHRQKISSKEPFYISSGETSFITGDYLGFTFDADDFKRCRRYVRKKGTGEYREYQKEKLPIEERWSARFFGIKDIFQSVNVEGASTLNVPWYYNIDSWRGLCTFLGSIEQKELDKPFNIGYHEWSPIGVDNEKE